MKRTQVPADVMFSTKPALPSKMTERSIDAGVLFRWVAANSIYGVSDEEHTLHHAGISYVLTIKGNHWFGSWATEPH